MAQDTQSVPTKEQIETRAYELYQARGCQDGYALEDWYAAESELTNQFKLNEPRAAAAPDGRSKKAGAR